MNILDDLEIRYQPYVEGCLRKLSSADDRKNLIKAHNWATTDLRRHTMRDCWQAADSFSSYMNTQLRKAVDQIAQQKFMDFARTELLGGLKPNEILTAPDRSRFRDVALRELNGYLYGCAA
jgi:hypothetical protein